MLSYDDIVLHLIVLVFAKFNFSSKIWIIFSCFGLILRSLGALSLNLTFYLYVINGNSSYTVTETGHHYTKSSLNTKNLIVIMHLSVNTSLYLRKFSALAVDFLYVIALIRTECWYMEFMHSEMWVMLKLAR